MLPGWTDSEKYQLLDALHKYGGENVEQIAAEIPSKSVAKVEKAIHFYKIQALIDSKKEACDQDHQHEAPLKDWIENLKIATDAVSSDPNASADIAAAYQLMATNVPYAEDEIDFKGCYEFIADLMLGKKPKPLETEAMVYLSVLFEVMEEFIQDQGIEKEREFLSKLTESHISQNAEKWKKTAECCGGSSSSKASCLSCDPDINILKIPAHLLKSITE